MEFEEEESSNNSYQIPEDYEDEDYQPHEYREEAESNDQSSEIKDEAGEETSLVDEETSPEEKFVAYYTRKRNYKPLKRIWRIRLLRDFIVQHRWNDAAKWLKIAIDDTSASSDLLYRATMIVLEVNKPKDTPFQVYYSRSISPLVKSFLVMDLNKREVLLDVCTLLCNNNLFEDARQFLEENSRIMLCAESSIGSLKGFRQNDTIDSCLACLKAFLSYQEWRLELQSSPGPEHMEELRRCKAERTMSQLRFGISFSQHANLERFIFSLQDMYTHYGLVAETVEMWTELINKHPDNLFIILGFWRVLDTLQGNFAAEKLFLFKKLQLLDPGHPMILKMIESGVLAPVDKETTFEAVAYLMDFVDYQRNDRENERAWSLLVQLISQMDTFERDRVHSLYTCKYQSYWQYTHLSAPREASNKFALLLTGSPYTDTANADT